MDYHVKETPENEAEYGRDANLQRRIRGQGIDQDRNSRVLPSLDSRGELEDRQIHRYHQPPNQNTQYNHDHGLH